MSESNGAVDQTPVLITDGFDAAEAQAWVDKKNRAAREAREATADGPR